jgi:hypothetical protein
MIETIYILRNYVDVAFDVIKQVKQQSAAEPPNEFNVMVSRW